MKDDRRMERLYENLTAEEKAALVFASLARLDKAEADRIDSTVAHKVYRVQDLAFSDRYDRLIKLALLWGVTWWHEFAKVAASLGLLGSATGRMNGDLAEEACETFAQGLARIALLEDELDAACHASGVDADAVREFAMVGKRRPPLIELPPELAMAPSVEFVENIREMLTKLVR